MVEAAFSKVRSRRNALSVLGTTTLIAGLPRRVGAQSLVRAPITVAVAAATDVLPYFYAVQQGMFEKAGLDITQILGTSGSANLVAVAGGSAHIGFANCLSLIIAHTKGVPIALVAPGGGYESSNPWAQLIVAADSPIKTAKDLEGRTLGVTGLHDLFAIATEAWMEKEGADRSKVHFLELPPSAMLAGLQSKHIDAFTIQEPFRGAAVAAGARALASPYDAIAKQFLTAAWFANTDWTAGNRDAAIRFAQVIHQAAEYTNAHYDQLLPLIASYSKISLDLLKQSRPIRVPLSLNAALIQPLIDVATQFHEIAAPFRAQDLVLSGVP